MIGAAARLIRESFSTAAEQFGAAWNRFWFTPGSPLTLCMIRVLTGLVVLYWLATFTPDLARLFGPDGLVGGDLVQRWRGDRAGWSYLDYATTTTALYGLHAVGLAAAAAFAVGFYTRWATVLTLVVVLSYIHRGPMLTSQVDHILVLVLLYLCLAPAGAYWSVDRWRMRRKLSPTALAARDRQTDQSLSANIATRLMQVHVALIYLVMALAKMNDGVSDEFGMYHAWWQGHAVWHLAAMPESALIDVTPLLAGRPYLMNLWTYSILLLEVTFPVLIWNRYARPLVLMAAVPVWLSVAVLTGLGAFCAMMIVASLAFVSPSTVCRLIASGGEACPVPDQSDEPPR